MEVDAVMAELFLLVLGHPSKVPEVGRRVNELWLKKLGGKELYMKVGDLGGGGAGGGRVGQGRVRSEGSAIAFGG